MAISAFNLNSLFIETLAKGNRLGTATGFTVKKGKQFYLITNWHVVSGKNRFSNEIMHSSKATPDSIKIYFHSEKSLLVRNWLIKNLYTDQYQNNPIWLEYKLEHHWCPDVVAIPLYEKDLPEETKLYALDIWTDLDFLTPCGTSVSVVGFPYGIIENLFLPIWKTGHIATEIEIDY